MTFRPTAIAGVLVVEPELHRDARGFLFESFRRDAFEAAAARAVDFVQDNHSLSTRGVLRGLHYQLPGPQGKLVRVVRGEIFDVAVDLRRGSPTLGRWVAERLSAGNRRQLWIPEGMAHGFLALSDEAEVLYRVTAYRQPAHERCIRWDDPDLAVAWPLDGAPPRLSARDAAGGPFAGAPLHGAESAA
jgi:dTDP-4-dehydrorhamnose 3,5-epimerase